MQAFGSKQGAHSKQIFRDCASLSTQISDFDHQTKEMNITHYQKWESKPQPSYLIVRSVPLRFPL